MVAMNLPPSNADIYHLRLSMLEERTESIDLRIRMDEAEAIATIEGGEASAELLIETNRLRGC